MSFDCRDDSVGNGHEDNFHNGFVREADDHICEEVTTGDHPVERDGAEDDGVG